MVKKKTTAIETLFYPSGEKVCWAPAYAKKDLPPSDTTNYMNVIVGLLRCQTAEPEDEYAVVDNMTGRYESGANMCCVNQAGYHMQLWHSTKAPGRKLTRYSADYDPDAATPKTFAIREMGDLSAFIDPSITEGRREPVASFLTLVATSDDGVRDVLFADVPFAELARQHGDDVVKDPFAVTEPTVPQPWDEDGD